MTWDQLTPRAWYTLHWIAPIGELAEVNAALAQRLQRWRASPDEPEMRIELSSTGNPPATHAGCSGPLETNAVHQIVDLLEQLKPEDRAIVASLDGLEYWNSADGFATASRQVSFDDCRRMFTPVLEVIKPQE